VNVWESRARVPLCASIRTLTPPPRLPFIRAIYQLNRLGHGKAAYKRQYLNCSAFRFGRRLTLRIRRGYMPSPASGLLDESIIMFT
jgi:hypothetical protein